METHMADSGMHKRPSPGRPSAFLRIPFIKGVIIIMWGILALLFASTQQIWLVRSFGLLNFVVFIMTLVFILKNKHLEISTQWVTIEAAVELIAGIVFTFFVKDTDQFMYYMGGGIIFIVILQFVHGFNLLNSAKFNMTNFIMRFVVLIGGAIISISFLANIISVVGAFMVMGAFSLVYGMINIHFGISLNNAILGQAE